MNPQRRTNVLAFETSRTNSRLQKLDSVKCRMLPAQLSTSSGKWPSISVKAKTLSERQPNAAALIESLLDDLLSEVS